MGEESRASKKKKKKKKKRFGSRSRAEMVFGRNDPGLLGPDTFAIRFGLLFVRRKTVFPVGSAKIRNGQFLAKGGEMGNFWAKGGEMDNFWAKWAW